MPPYIFIPPCDLTTATLMNHHICLWWRIELSSYKPITCIILEQTICTKLQHSLATYNWACISCSKNGLRYVNSTKVLDSFWIYLEIYGTIITWNNSIGKWDVYCLWISNRQFLDQKHMSILNGWMWFWVFKMYELCCFTVPLVDSKPFLFFR